MAVFYHLPKQFPLIIGCRDKIILFMIPQEPKLNNEVIGPTEHNRCRFVSLNNISVLKGDTQILEDVSVDIYSNDHIALVGPNGAGKTTLIELLIGEEEPDSGTINTFSDFSIAYVPQSIENIFPRRSNHSVIEYFYHARGLDVLRDRMFEIESKLAESGEWIESLIAEYGELQTKFQLLGGYRIESDAEAIMRGLNLPYNIDLESPIESLSGGEKTKLFLAQALIGNADLLLLDEPSNHLDPDSIEWLGDYLRHYRGALMVTSHKPIFLSAFTNKGLKHISRW